jgi:hypothetical protein
MLAESRYVRVRLYWSAITFFCSSPVLGLPVGFSKNVSGVILGGTKIVHGFNWVEQKNSSWFQTGWSQKIVHGFKLDGEKKIVHGFKLGGAIKKVHGLKLSSGFFTVFVTRSPSNKKK